MTMSKTLE